MSGHSKWSTIKHKKAAQDQKRGKLFTKLIQAIQIAAQEGGPNPDTNYKLRLAVDRAKSFNVPKDKIEGALTPDESKPVEAFTLDAIGPGGTAFLVECATDNRNRTVAEIRHMFSEHGGKLAENGAASWAFARKGFVFVPKKEEAEENETLLLELIGAGAEDVREENGMVAVVTEPEKLQEVAERIKEKDVAVEDAELGWLPTQEAPVSGAEKQKIEALFEALDDHPDVQNFWANEVHKNT